MAGIIIGILFGIIGLVGAYFSFQSLPIDKREKYIHRSINLLNDAKNFFYSLIPKFLLNPVLFFDKLSLMDKRFIYHIINNPNGKAEINEVKYLFLETNRKSQKRKNDMLTRLKNRNIIKIKKENVGTHIMVSNKIIKQYEAKN